MQTLPNTKSGLEKLAIRGLNATKRAAYAATEKKEGRNELMGAGLLLPIVRDFSPMIPMVNKLGMPPELRDAAVAYAISMYTSGDLSEAAWGACLGGVGAWSYKQKALLGGMFGGGTNG